MALEKAVRRNIDRFIQAFNTETRIALKSRSIHWLGWLWPLLLFLLIGSIFRAGTLLDMPIAVVDNDHSSLSRQIVREMDAASHARVQRQEYDLQEGLRGIQEADQYSLLYIPRDFEADGLAGKQPRAVLYYNGLFYSAGYYSTQDFPGLMVQINNTYRSRLTAGAGQPVPPLASITVSQENLFNASGNYIYYQQFAAMVHLLQMFVIVTTIHVLACEAPELRSLARHVLRGRGLLARLLGKLAPYTLLFTTLLLLQIFLLVVLNGARIKGSPVWMIAICFCYVMAAQSVGMLLFSLTSHRLNAYTLVGLLVGIAQTYSGLLLPELAMPEIARVIGTVEPLTHAMRGLFDQFLREAPAASGLVYCGQLLTYPLIIGLTVRRRLPKRLNLHPAAETSS